MENLIEHEGKKYRVVEGHETPCIMCAFRKKRLCLTHATVGFPNCVVDDCHFELVEETNEKE